MLATYASPEGMHCFGSIDDVPEKLAVELVAGGFAEYAGPVEKVDVKASPIDENTSKIPVENTTVRTTGAPKRVKRK